jgi:hypothetical protein
MIVLEFLVALKRAIVHPLFGPLRDRTQDLIQMALCYSKSTDIFS